MASAFVQFVFDTAQRRPLNHTFDAYPPLQTDRPHLWTVVHDVRGRIVVRSFSPLGGGSYVIGNARWENGKTVERASINDTTPSAQQWDLLDAALSELLAQAPAGDPGAIDDGVVLPESTPLGKRARLIREGKVPPPASDAVAKRTGFFSTTGSFIALLIVGVIVAAVAGVVLWLKNGSEKNGGECSSDSRCKSGRCIDKRCEAPGRRGDVCKRDGQCTSGKCSRKSCD